MDMEIVFELQEEKSLCAPATWSSSLFEAHALLELYITQLRTAFSRHSCSFMLGLMQ